MDSSCYQSARFDRVRISQLDPTTLAPVDDADGGYVTDKQVLMALSPVILTGEEFEQKTGAGEICASFQEEDQLQRVTVRLQVCTADPFLDHLLTGARMFIDNDVVVGSQAPATGEALSNPVCIEGWTRAWDGTSQAIPPVTSPALAWWHWVIPYFHGGVPADWELNNGIHVFEYTGRGDENGAITANGPFNDWPVYVVDAGGVTGVWGKFLDTAPPDAACESIPVPAGS